MPPTPYVVGQWVRGHRFYGRTALIEEILEGPRSSLWLLGTRRVGKTSLLKQIEHLTESDEKPRYLPVFWDFQGAAEPRELHLSFAEAVLDAGERLGRLGIEPAEVEDDDLFASLGRLRRRLRASDLRLLLLCDEVEELIELRRKDPSLLRKLRRAMQGPADLRTVLASTIRLWDLAEQREDTSPFLHGFTPPLYIERLTDEEARALIQQSHLEPAARPRFTTEAVETIRRRCDNHPYLLQLVCKRFLESGELAEATEQVATDRMVSYFFSIDFEMLSEQEQQALRTIALRPEVTGGDLQQTIGLTSPALEGTLQRLEQLGFVRRDEARRFALPSYFFGRWLREMPAQVPPSGRSPSSATAWGSGEVTWPAEPVLGVVDDRYELLAVAGEGATGIVYRAFDRQLRTRIAIKVLRPELTGTEDVEERFRKEIVLSRDIGHPNILRVYHLGTFQGRTYLTMQWVDGPTLAEVIAREGPLAEEAVLSIGRKLASALEAAHGREVLHRDVKPQNILIDQAGEPLMTDFGLARLKGEPGLTQNGMFLGTPNYASPEQVQLKPTDERSDIYALGVVLFEMATGRRPFEAASVGDVLRMHRGAPPPDPRAIVPSLPAELSRIILRCLRKDPAERYPSAAALREALAAVASEPSG